MSRYAPEVEHVEFLNGNICKVKIKLERPSRKVIDNRKLLEQTNEWAYVGTISDGWLLVDGSAVAPAEHAKICDDASRPYILQQRYKPYLEEFNA